MEHELSVLRMIHYIAQVAFPHMPPRVWPKWGRKRSKSAEFGPNLGQVRASSTASSQCWPGIGKILFDVGQSLARIRSTLYQFRPSLPEFGEQVGPASSMFADFGRKWPESDCMLARFGQNWSGIDKTSPTPVWINQWRPMFCKFDPVSTKFGPPGVAER